MPTNNSKRFPVGDVTLAQLIELRDLIVNKANDLEYGVVAATKAKVTVGDTVPSYYADNAERIRRLAVLHELITGDPLTGDPMTALAAWDAAVEDSVDPEAADA